LEIHIAYLVSGMSNTLRRLLFLWIAILSAGSPAVAQQTQFSILAFYSDKTEPDHVEFAEQALKFFRDRAASENFTFAATTDWRDLNDERLQTVQLVVWLNESPQRAEQRRAFERYMQRGGAWLGFHAAAYNDESTNWPWFVDFLGGAVFHINSWPPLPAKLAIDDRSHPVTAGISDFDSPANEWYIWEPSPRLNKDVRVLLTLDPSNYPIGLKDVLTSGDLPVVWTNTKFKMLYMNMGHGDKIFTSTEQNQLIDNAVHWLGTGATEPAALQANAVRIPSNGIRVSSKGIALNTQTGKFYAVNAKQDSVRVLDANGHLLTSIPVGRQPQSIAINPDTNRVYVTNSGSGTVAVINGGTDKTIANVPVGSLPYMIAVNRATKKIYVSRTFSDVTVIIDGQTNAAKTVKAGAGDAVAAESLENNTYLINYENPDVTVFDGTNDHVDKIKASNHLWSLAAIPMTKKIYAVSVGAAEVTVIGQKLKSTTLRGIGELPCAIAVDYSSGKVFVANYGSNNVSVIDGATDSVVTTISVAPNPQAIAVDSSNHNVYVASTREGTVTVLDGTSNSVLGKVKASKAPYAVAINNKSHKAVVLDLGGGLTVIDGTSLTTTSPSANAKSGH
jgi:YVTN family beta-propeller protein